MRRHDRLGAPIYLDFYAAIRTIGTMFPVIATIDDVLPSVEGRGDMVVAEKDGYTVVKYNFQTSDTFDASPHGIIRRECRGLLFDTEGRLISRPFHKFFNVGEKEETFPRNIDLSRPHFVQEKLDGSMIRPFYKEYGGHDASPVFFGTKSGITDTSDEARRVFDAQDETGEKLQWIRGWLNIGYTPIFEYIGPDNRIVLKYPEPDLVFLALRSNRTGEYHCDHEFGPYKRYPGSTVKNHGGFNGSVDEYVAGVRREEDREGDVLVFDGGFRVKIKSEWYVRIHGIKENIEKGRYIAAQALDETLDDAISVLSEEDSAEVVEKADAFIGDYRAKLKNIRAMLGKLDEWLAANGGDNPRKAAATEFIPQNVDKADVKFVFSHMDGKDMDEMFDTEVRKGLGSDTRYDTLREWMSA